MSRFNANVIKHFLFVLYTLMSRLLVRRMKRLMRMMKTPGGMRGMTRTRCLTWTSLFFRRAPGTCYPRCASWPYSTRLSPSSVWSGTTVWRYTVLYRWRLGGRPAPRRSGQLKRRSRSLLGSFSGFQEGEGDRQEARVWRFVHHRAAVGRRHQRPVGSPRHQHAVSRARFRCSSCFVTFTARDLKVLHLDFRSFPNNYWDKFIKRKVGVKN